MGKKKQRNQIGEALSEALNAAFEFGMAHQIALDAGEGAREARDRAMETSGALAALVIPRDKKELN